MSWSPLPSRLTNATSAAKKAVPIVLMGGLVMFALPLIANRLEKKKDESGYKGLIGPKRDACLAVALGCAVLAPFALQKSKDKEWREKAAQAEKFLGCSVRTITASVSSGSVVSVAEAASACDETATSIEDTKPVLLSEPPLPVSTPPPPYPIQASEKSENAAMTEANAGLENLSLAETKSLLQRLQLHLEMRQKQEEYLSKHNGKEDPCTISVETAKGDHLSSASRAAQLIREQSNDAIKASDKQTLPRLPPIRPVKPRQLQMKYAELMTGIMSGSTQSSAGAPARVESWLNSLNGANSSTSGLLVAVTTSQVHQA